MLYLTILFGISALISFLLGIITLSANHKKRSNQTFFFFCLFGSLWALSLYISLFTPGIYPQLSFVFGRLAYGLSTLIPICVPIFFYFFPKKTFKWPKKLSYPLLLFYALFFILTTFTPLVLEEQIIEDGIWVADILGPMHPLYGIYILIHLAIAVVIAIYKIIKTQGIDRKKISMAATGFFAFYIFAMVINVILPLFNIFILQSEVVVSLLFFSVPTFIAIRKFRFFEFSTLALNALMYLILITAFLASEILLISLTESFLSERLSFIVSSVISLILTYIIFQNLPKFTGRGVQEFKNTVVEVCIRAYHCKTYESLQSLIEESFIQKLHLSRAEIFSVRKQTLEMNIPQYKDDEFTEILKTSKTPLLVKKEIQYLKLSDPFKKILSVKMKMLKAEICTPLFTENRLIGLFLLGEKSDGAAYSLEEIDEIKKVKTHLEVSWMNILIKQNLEQENNIMKNIINQKTQELKNKIKDIEQLVKQQSDFIAVTSHEFRTPLSIALFQLIDIIDSHEHVSEVQTELQTVLESLDALKNLSQKLFDVEKYDLNKINLHLSPVNPEAFFQKIFHGFQLQSQRKGLTFSFHSDISIREISIDLDQMRQVCLNLLTNAAKFTPENHAKIALKLTETPSDLEIRIIDNGRGIPDQEKTEIFNKFSTGNSSIGKGKGIGMGLFICKKIIEAHGGQISIEDNEHQGAVFIITLPKKITPPQQS